MKRIASLLMSVILLWSAVGAVLPAAAAELPAPYAWLETDGGTLQVSEGVSVSPTGLHGRDDVVLLPDGGYGIPFDQDWSGFTVGGDIFGNVPDGEGAVLAIEYYLDLPSDGQYQVFRYQLGGDGFVDLFTLDDNLTVQKAGVQLIPLTAAAVSAYAAESAVLTVLGCPGGVGTAFIRSIRLIAPTYAAVKDNGYGYVSMGETTLCAYYPDVTGVASFELGYIECETSDGIPERPWLYRYITVREEWRASDEVSNRPVYIKLYAAEGHENDRIHIDSIEREAGKWGEGGTVQMTNGMGGLYVPYTNFTNGLNSVGSFRFWWTEAEKVARVELYDIATHCLHPTADEERVAWLHDRMCVERIGTTYEGYRAPTADEVGYSGDICCAACHAVLENGKDIPRLPDDGLPTPYGRLETVTGVTWAGDGFDVAPSGIVGNDRTVPIGSTGEYGIRLDADWSGLMLTGEAFRAVPQGEQAVLAIEYYIDSDTEGQMFRYKVGPYPQVDLFSNIAHLTNRASGVVLCALTPEEIAALAAGEPLYILGCPDGAGVTYVQSVQLVEPQYAAGADVGRDRVALVDVPLCVYYPDTVGRYNYGMRFADVREGYDAMGKLQRYTYFEVTQSQAAAGAKTSPVVIRFTFKEDSTVTQMTLDYQCARPQSLLDDAVWASRTVTVTDGVAEVFLEDACFTNGLYEIGSFRLPNTEACPAVDQLATVEVIPVAQRDSLREQIGRADELTAAKTSDSVAEFWAVVQDVTAVCDDPWATPDEIAEAEAELITAASRLVPCPHRYTDERDTECDDCGAVREVVTVLTGDVNGDGKIDSTDARLTLQYAVGKIDAAALNITAADVDGNGKVDSTDARLILQVAVKKINGFPKG